MIEVPAIDHLSPLPLEAWIWRDQKREYAQRLARQVLEQSARADQVLRAQAQVVLAYLAFREGRMADALEQGGQAIQVLRQQQQTVWVARALNVRVCVTAELGEFTSAGAAIEEQLHLSRHAGDLEMEACALHDLGMIQFARSIKMAEPHLLAALEVFARLGSGVGQAFTKINLASMYEQLGQLERAKTMLEEALSLAISEGVALVETLARVQQGRLAIQQGEFAQAEVFLNDALERGLRNGERDLWEIVPSLVQVHLHFGRSAQAVALLEHHLGVVRNAGLRPFEMAAHELLAEVLQGMGDAPAALEHYRTHVKLHRQVFDDAYEERTRALAVLVRTQIAEKEAQAERQKNMELRATLQELAQAHQHILEISFTDELTKVRNRRYLMTHGEAQLRDAKGRTFTVALLDLDHFKRINDTLGHDGGDRVLCEFAGVVQASLRSGDTFARFGGEEFAIILPDTPLQTARDILERLRAIMATRTWHALPAGGRITFTAGLVDASSGNLMQALKQADQLLYVGKAEGRDRICM